MPLVSVIIINYNAGPHLARCLAHLLAQSFTDFEILLVDNASTDRSMETIPLSHKIQVIKAPKNLGFAAANNVAAAQAKGTWLALLNPDAFPEKDWLEQLICATRDYPGFSMFGSTQICDEDRALLDGSGDIYHIIGIPRRSNYLRPVAQLPETGEVFSPCAAAALYRKDIFLKAGGFDEKFFCYCEDIDLAFRLRLKGERCLQVRQAVVHHVGSAISKKSSGFARYYGIRNRFLVFAKNMPTALLIPLMPLHLLFQCAYGINACRRGERKIFLEAWKDILVNIPALRQSRREVQARRTVSLWQIARAFTLSPVKILNKKADIRQV